MGIGASHAARLHATHHRSCLTDGAIGTGDVLHAWRHSGLSWIWAWASHARMRVRHALWVHATIVRVARGHHLWASSGVGRGVAVAGRDVERCGTRRGTLWRHVCNVRKEWRRRAWMGRGVGASSARGPCVGGRSRHGVEGGRDAAAMAGGREVLSRRGEYNGRVPRGGRVMRWPRRSRDGRSRGR